MAMKEREKKAFENLIRLIVHEDGGTQEIPVGGYWSVREMRKRFYKWRSSQNESTLPRDLTPEDLYKVQVSIIPPRGDELHHRLRFMRKHDPLEAYTDAR